MLGELKRYFRKTGWSAHVPRGAQEMALRVDRAAHDLGARSGRQPRVNELAEYLELSAEDIIAALDAGNAHYAVSLDAPLAPADPSDLYTLVETISHAAAGYGLVETAASLSVAIRRLPYL
jgi:RNA polymerase sigma-B factor